MGFDALSWCQNYFKVGLPLKLLTRKENFFIA
jgi:hypothetical protein